MSEDKKAKTEYVALCQLVVPGKGDGTYNKGQPVPVSAEEGEALREQGFVATRAEYDAAEKAKAEAQQKKADAVAAQKRADIERHAAGAETREFTDAEMPSGKEAKAKGDAEKK